MVEVSHNNGQKIQVANANYFELIDSMWFLYEKKDGNLVAAFVGHNGNPITSLRVILDEFSIGRGNYS